MIRIIIPGEVQRTINPIVFTCRLTLSGKEVNQLIEALRSFNISKQRNKRVLGHYIKKIQC